MKKLLSALLSSLFVLGMLSTAALASESSASERERHLQTIEDFLNNPSIHDAITQKHGKNVDTLMKKVSKLGNWELGQLAKHTPDLIQYGAETQRVESGTAEKISDGWLKFAYTYMTVGIIVLVLLLLL